MLTYRDPLPRRPERVVVAGVSGSGKTTFARRVADVTGGPHTEIDSLFHGPHWTERAAFVDDVRALVAGDRWTTEWQYSSARPLLAERADTLLWLDYPFARVTLPRVVRRTVRRRLRREVLWNGNVEPALWTFLTDRDHIVRWAIRTRHKYRDSIATMTDTHSDLVIVRLRHPREADEWLHNLTSADRRID